MEAYMKRYQSPTGFAWTGLDLDLMTFVEPADVRI
jgi:hypothetical protein